MEVKRRVKVYQLDPSGKWDDKGTGHVTCSPGQGGMTIIVTSEEDGSKILETRVFDESSYQRQQDTLILWTDPTSNIDLALSFQEPEGCQEVWETIVNDPESITLGEPTLENLAQISDIIDPLSSNKEKIAMSLCKEDFIKQLLDLFDKVEPNQDKEQLYHFFHIFKNIILMNETSLFETILSEDYILRVMGPLEYDPDISEQNRIKHREFLNSHVVFKEVLKLDEIQQSIILPLIHQTFRVQYLKDVVLPRVLDDLTFATLNSIIYFNNSEIVNYLLSNPSLIQQVISTIETSEPSSKEKKDSLLFLQELCGIAKGLQPSNKIQFFSTFTDNDDEILKTLKIAIDDDAPQCRLSCAEIILSILQFDARILRNYISLDYSFFSKLISRFINDSDIGVKNQIAEIIKILVEAESNEMTDFFKLFYEKGIYELVEPLNDTNQVNGEPMIPGDPSSNLRSFVLSSVIELIIYCIKHHSHRIRNFIIKENITSKILALTTSSEKYLALGAIRYFRCLVVSKDDIFIQHIIQDNLIDPIIDIFRQNVSRYNLLNSAVLDLLYTIHRDNSKDLIVYVVNRYKDAFESITYTDIMKQLAIRADNISNTFESPEITCNTTIQRNERELDDEEEAYFSRDDSDDSDDNDPLSELKYYNLQQQHHQQQQQQLQRLSLPSLSSSVVGNTSNRLTKLVDYDDDDDEDFILTSNRDNNNNNRDNNNNNATTTTNNNNDNNDNTTTTNTTKIFEQQQLEPSTIESTDTISPTTTTTLSPILKQQDSEESAQSNSICNKEPDETVCNGANHKSMDQDKDEEEEEREKDTNVQNNHKQQQQQQEEDTTTNAKQRVIKRKSIESNQDNNNNDFDQYSSNNGNGDIIIDSNHVDSKILKQHIHNEHNNNSNNNNDNKDSDQELSSIENDGDSVEQQQQQHHRTIKRVKIKDSTTNTNNNSNNNNNEQKQPQQQPQCAIVDSKE